MTRLFVSIEGGEGAGKSLLMEGLVAYFVKTAKNFVRTREPGGTPLADQVRSLFLDPPAADKPTALTELLLVSAARAQHVEKKIKPALASGQWVLCDRFYDSTRVYQGRLGGIPQAVLESIVAASVNNCHPDLTFVLDCPPELAQMRVQERARAAGHSMDSANRYDGGDLQLYRALREGYLSVAKQFPERIVLLDATQTPERVLQQALAILDERCRL